MLHGPGGSVVSIAKRQVDAIGVAVDGLRNSHIHTVGVLLPRKAAWNRQDKAHLRVGVRVGCIILVAHLKNNGIALKILQRFSVRSIDVYHTHALIKVPTVIII